MDNLQYDSFYKFLVSLGIILIAAPLVALYYLIFNGNQILISQEEYNQLSENSRFILQKREFLITTIFKLMPVVLLILILVGVICLLYGAYKWKLLQKEIDEQMHGVTLLQRKDIEKLTHSEATQKTMNELIQEPSTTASSFKQALIKSLEIEDSCFKYLSQKLSKKYVLDQDVRISRYEYDIIARAKFDGADYLYEVKYWTKLPPKAGLTNIIESLDKGANNYTEAIRKNCFCVLLIVCPDNLCPQVKDFCKKYSEEHSLRSYMKIEVLSESNL